MVKEKHKPLLEEDIHLSDPLEIILFNDDINSFGFVIETLIDVCKHEPEQAEQCAWIAHFTGKCPVMSGDLQTLQPAYHEMINRGLTVSITK
jgi:ATP-dependent Clp protease adaptor protein ClpS